MIVADAAKVTAAAWFLSVVIVSARPLLFGDAFTLSFDTRNLIKNVFIEC